MSGSTEKGRVQDSRREPMSLNLSFLQPFSQELFLTRRSRLLREEST